MMEESGESKARVYGYEDDVYGSCSCGETKPHRHDALCSGRDEVFGPGNDKVWRAPMGEQRGEFVTIPMDMAQDLRQWAEALSVVEGWTLDSYGSQVLRRYKALLLAISYGGETPLHSQPIIRGESEAVIGGIPGLFPVGWWRFWQRKDDESGRKETINDN